MNYQKTIKQEGYRREDLTEEHREQLAWLDMLREDLQNAQELIPEEVQGDDKGLIGSMKAEIAYVTMCEVLDFVDARIAEYQIHMAESEGVEQ